MPKTIDAFRDGPMWGWGDVSFESAPAEKALVVLLPYWCSLPCETLTNGATVFRNNVLFHQLVGTLPLDGSVSPRSIDDVLAEQATQFVKDACKDSESVSLRTIGVAHVPAMEAVAICFDTNPATTSNPPTILLVPVPPAIRDQEAIVEAWDFADRILKRQDESKRREGLLDFLAYTSSRRAADHPIQTIRCDLEEAILTTPSRDKLKVPRPSDPIASDYLSILPTACVLEGEAAPTAAALADQSLLNAGIRPPRDGVYRAVFDGFSDKSPRWLISWIPHDGPPPFPVVKAALCDRYPHVRNDPLSDRCEPSDRPSPTTRIDVPSTEAPPIAEIAIPAAFSDEERFRLADVVPVSWDLGDLKRDRASIAKVLEERGFEALAWHQGFHHHDDSTWGIFFHSERIDCFVSGVYAAMLEDKKLSTRPNYGFVAAAVLQWIAEHEWFHARVEAALSYLELTSGVPRYLPYNKNVYQPLCCKSDDCLEEALANHSAQHALLSGWLPAAGLLSKPEQASLARALETEMALSPPGSRAWQKGDDLGSWRRLAWELTTGQPSSPASAPQPPLESLLLGPLPYDHSRDDIAWFTYGIGHVTSRLLSSPATLRVPSRHELRSALRLLGYECRPGRGKGSHEMWFNRDEKGFPLPVRDPVGRQVFDSFLRHTGLLSKARYIADIRPKL
jgi:hypothetical protein